MKIRFFRIILIITLLGSFFESAFAQARHQRDSLKMVSDSLMEIIRIKDSMLLQATLDSIYMYSMIEAQQAENDSLLHELRKMILTEKLDSVNQYRIDSINRDINRFARWELKDSLYNIDEDSVRRSLNSLLGEVFHDSARSPNFNRLRQSMSSLFHHLANDSVHLSLINASNDTIPFVLKKNQVDSTAMFLVNSRMDSVKIYLYGNEKESIYLIADDAFMLTRMLKPDMPDDILERDWANIQKVTIPKRTVPPDLVKPWTARIDFDVRLNQIAFSHWPKGGVNNITLQATSKGYANYIKGKMQLQNSFNYSYGVIKQEGAKLNKNVEDLLIKNSFHHKAYKNYHYTLSSDFRSQIFPGYRLPNDSIPISKFMSPAIYNIGVGMTYKPGKGLEITGNPLSGNFKFVLDTALINPKLHGVPENKTMSSAIGTTIFVKYSNSFWNDIKLSTQLKLFQSYINKAKPEFDWRNDISLKLNKYLNLKFSLLLKYDDDVILPDYEYIEGVRTKIGEGKYIQVQQNFGITFSFGYW